MTVDGNGDERMVDISARSGGELPPISPVLNAAIRILAWGVVVVALLFLLNNYLTFWLNWPGFLSLLAHQEWLGLGPLRSPLDDEQVTRGWLQLWSYLVPLLLVCISVVVTRQRPLRADARLLTGFAAYIVRAAFWAVLLVGLADVLVSFLRVEGFLASLVGTELTSELGRPQQRGAYLHYPLIGIALIIALFVRSLGFVWLALLVVFAEFQIVISRFVFSYEQAFMGDLVRFWYAALFLFASAYALVEEGHVRVDVLYAHFSERGKAWTNLLGSLFLGLPLCWVILTQGMWSKGSSINSPLLSFEISQAGYGMYVKYLMAGFLVVFAVSMAVQFASYLLVSVAELGGERNPPDAQALSGS